MGGDWNGNRKGDWNVPLQDPSPDPEIHISIAERVGYLWLWENLRAELQ